LQNLTFLGTPKSFDLCKKVLAQVIRMRYAKVLTYIVKASKQTSSFAEKEICVLLTLSRQFSRSNIRNAGLEQRPK
jgi:hypothetical protein